MGNWFHSLLQNIIDGLGEALEWVIDLLPDSPFNLIDNSAISDYLGAFNWIVPMDQIIAILQLWVSAILVYYAWVVVLRWIKAID